MMALMAVGNWDLSRTAPVGSRSKGATLPRSASVVRRSDDRFANKGRADTVEEVS